MKDLTLILEEIVLNETRMTLNEQVKYLSQPTGNSCGPTCIKMVGDFLKGEVPSIEEICKMCGTDWVVGTPPEFMRKGLNQLQIPYIEHQLEIEPFQSLKNTIDKGNVAIVRTVTQGVPHWIVIDDYDGDTFSVNDPWLGQIEYDEYELEEIWAIRDFFYFEILSGQKEIAQGVEIRKMKTEDIPVIYERLQEVFERTNMSNQTIWDVILEEEPDANFSFVATVGGEIAGFYFISPIPIPEIEGVPYDEFEDTVGVEGVALGVFPEYKNLGIGKKLIEESQTALDADYIWGMQLKSLKNIDDWLKRRELYYETPTYYITYQFLR